MSTDDDEGTAPMGPSLLIRLAIALVVFATSGWGHAALAIANGAHGTPLSSTDTYYRFDQAAIVKLRAVRTELRTTRAELQQLDAVMFSLVKRHRLAPTQASKVLAYLLSAQADAAALSDAAHGEYQGSVAPLTARILCVFLRSECASLARDLPEDAYSTMLADLVVEKVLIRLREENDRTRPYVRRHGDQYWWAEWPTTTYAGSWTPWLIGSGSQFRAEPPPPYGSARDLEEVAAVKQAAAQRSPEQQRAVLYWAGGPGTETPAGIWLGLANDHLAATSAPLDQALAVRSKLAMTMADAFIACWDTKYSYWTKRPFMRDPEIEPSIPTPNFPSYTSGHATVSAAAATILGHYFPDRARRWMMLAEEARDSRLWSGIHFPIDNERGFLMGKAIAEHVLRRLEAGRVTGVPPTRQK